MTYSSAKSAEIVLSGSCILGPTIFKIPQPNWNHIYLELGFEFGLQIITDLDIVCP